MNDILNNGFVSPYIIFNFLGGTIDVYPPKYFVSFEHERNADEATEFTLVLMYVPGINGESVADTMHQLFLTSVKSPVTYAYGYVVPGGGIRLQNQWYRGIFTEYTEDLGSDGTLTYTVKGVSESIEFSTPHVNVEDFLANRKRSAGPTGKAKPSGIVEHLVTRESGIKEYFENWNIVIDHTDEEVDIKSINVKNGTIREVLCGSYNADGTKNMSGFVSYSNSKIPDDSALSPDVSPVSGLSGIAQQVAEAKQNIKNRIRTIPYICYFDNIIESAGSSLKGSFHYVPKLSTGANDVAGTFTYNFGNSFLDSDVLSFSVSNDCTVPLASASALKKVDTDITDTGDSVGASYNVLCESIFKKNTFNTPSGFDESSFFTESVLSELLNFPFEATMTILGQLECSHLLDKIQVNVIINGVEHPYLTGVYVIEGITDSLSDSGFTTQLKLFRNVSGSIETEAELTSARDSMARQREEAHAYDFM